MHKLQTLLLTGSIPYKLEIIKLDTISPSLGEAFTKSMISLAFVVFVIVSLWWQNGISPVNPKEKALKLFVIPKGAAIRVIGNDLKSQGLIKDPVVFFLYIKQNSLDKNILRIIFMQKWRVVVYQK